MLAVQKSTGRRRDKNGIYSRWSLASIYPDSRLPLYYGKGCAEHVEFCGLDDTVCLLRSFLGYGFGVIVESGSKTGFDLYHSTQLIVCFSLNFDSYADADMVNSQFIAR